MRTATQDVAEGPVAANGVADHVFAAVPVAAAAVTTMREGHDSGGDAVSCGRSWW